MAIKEGLLFLIPEPKSPHGVDVTPDGKYIIVSGKLDTHVSVYSFEKIQAAIKAGKFESKDPYGIPVIGMKDALATSRSSWAWAPAHPVRFQALRRLHLAVRRLPGRQVDYCEGKVLDKISVHYNIGHLMTMEGDSMEPAGKYLVALNKLAIDRFVPVGPLHPQNHQLIDISERQDAAALRHAAAAG
jgi:nitrous-oxide reductase